MKKHQEKGLYYFLPLFVYAPCNGSCSSHKIFPFYWSCRGESDGIPYMDGNNYGNNI